MGLGLLSSCWATLITGIHPARWGLWWRRGKVPPEGEEKKKTDEEEKEEMWWKRMKWREEKRKERQHPGRNGGVGTEEKKWMRRDEGITTKEEEEKWKNGWMRGGARESPPGTQPAGNSAIGTQSPVIIRIESTNETEEQMMNMRMMERGGSERRRRRRDEEVVVEEEDEEDEDEQLEDARRRMEMIGTGQQQYQQEKPLSLSVADVRLRGGGSATARSATAHSQHHRPCSSLMAGEQFGPGQPCARIRLSVQYSQQKKLLILTLNELVQTPGDDDVWLSDGSARGDKLALQIRLALLSECATQSAKVQKFQSKFVPLDPLIPIQFGQTFAFDVIPDQLAESVVRLRLYRKSRQRRVPGACVAVAFLRNYLVDAEARRAQNHFLQFRCVLGEPTVPEGGSGGGGGWKGNMSLFPSLLSLYHNFSSSHGPADHPPPAKPSPSPPPASASLNPPSPHSRGSVTHQQNSPSASRRGSTVDESGRFCALPQADGQNPEVLVSLCFFDGQSRLSVCVDKTALRKEGQREDGREQDVFVRIAAINREGAEIGKHKSPAVKAAPEVSLNTQAVFNVAHADLDSVHVLVQLFALHSGSSLFRRGARARRLIGQLQLGEEECSSPDAQQHWREMLQGMGTTVDKWHVLEAAP